MCLYICIRLLLLKAIRVHACRQPMCDRSALVDLQCYLSGNKALVAPFSVNSNHSVFTSIFILTLHWCLLYMVLITLSSGAVTGQLFGGICTNYDSSIFPSKVKLASVSHRLLSSRMLTSDTQKLYINARLKILL